MLKYHCTLPCTLDFFSNTDKVFSIEALYFAMVLFPVVMKWLMISSLICMFLGFLTVIKKSFFTMMGHVKLKNAAFCFPSGDKYTKCLRTKKEWVNVI
jgi:hypothetical protein